jgi:hypothetical protein
MKKQLQLDFPGEELTIGSVIWLKRGINKSTTFWTSDYYSADGDGVSCYVDSDARAFTLQCFSGIPASSIYIDHLDYECIWVKTKYKDQSIGKYSFIEQSLILADYFCTIHCEFISTKNYKHVV